MTGREFSEVDIDLLADYVCGALDGTPDEATVSALIADDPAWAEAHASLTLGMAAVGAGLHALGAEPITMPDDVAARVTAALGALDSGVDLRDAAPDDEDAAPDDELDEIVTPTRRHLSSVPSGGSATGAQRAGATTAPRRRRLRRWAAPIAAAAGVLAFAGVGLNHLTGGTDSASDSTAAGAYRGEEAADAPMFASVAPGDGVGVGGPAIKGSGRLNAPPSADRIITSGIDYDLVALQGEPIAMSATESSASDAAKQAPEPASGAVVDLASTAPALQRLNDREALLACLEAIASANGGGPISVTTVDFARYGGVPAVIVRFAAGNGEWAYAVGAGCGTPDAGAAILQPVQVS